MDKKHLPLPCPRHAAAETPQAEALRRQRQRRRRGVRASSVSDQLRGQTRCACRPRRTLGARRRALLAARRHVASAAADPTADGTAAQLPQPLLCLILRLACAGGAVPTACAAACVCRSWRAAVAAAGADLWHSADLSFAWCRPSDAVVTRLTVRGTWASLSALSLAGCATLSDKALEALSSTHTPALRTLDLRECRGFSAAALQRLAAASSLTSLDLSRVVLRPAGDFEKAVRGVCVAGSLTALSLAGCPRVTSATIRSVMQCPQLRSLNLTAAGTPRGVALHIEALQRACPLLEELHLSGLGLDGGFQAPPQAPGVPAGDGFPALRVCELAAGFRMTSHGAVPSRSFVDDAMLRRVLWTSSRLSRLALGGTLVTADGIAALPALDLAHVALEHSAAATDDAAHVVTQRWRHSLMVASFAGGGEAVTDATPEALSRCLRLHACDLSATAISVAGVRALLLREPAVDVTLTACRGLDRSLRRAALAGTSALAQALACS